MEQVINQENKYKRILHFLTVIIILLFIIIILFLLYYRSIKYSTCVGEHTGDYDIYEISIKGSCDSSTCLECDCPTSGTGSGVISQDNDISSNPVSNDYEPKDETGFIVYDTKNKWNSSSDTVQYQPNIFAHSMYEVIDNKIAPGTKNIYKFIVRNLNDFNVKYTISLKEVNPFDINMKYRLRDDSGYIIGNNDHWVDASSIITLSKSISSKNIDTYYLDWKWFDDTKDTKIGIDNTASYSVSIEVEAEE